MQKIKTAVPSGSASVSHVMSKENVTQLARRGTEVVVHVSNHLGIAERCYVEQQLCNFTGITVAQFCECHPHLLLVTYDAGRLDRDSGLFA